jgi:hypothetical protein
MHFPSTGLRRRAVSVDRNQARRVTSISAEERRPLPGYAGMSWRASRLVREEPDQVLRLQAYRAAHRPQQRGGVQVTQGHASAYVESYSRSSGCPSKTSVRTRSATDDHSVRRRPE